MSHLLELNQKEREELEKLLTQYKKKGVRMILYATRELSESETEEYKRLFNLFKSTLTSNDQQLEDLAITYEKNLNLLGIMGYKEELKPDAPDFIQIVK